MWYVVGLNSPTNHLPSDAGVTVLTSFAVSVLRPLQCCCKSVVVSFDAKIFMIDIEEFSARQGFEL